MLSINKKNGAKSPAPSAKQTGLFIDPDKRTVDEGGMVIDMPATTASAESAAPDRVEAKPVGGFRGFTVKKKTGGDSDEPGSSNDSGAKAGAFSSLSARFGKSKPKVDAEVVATQDVPADEKPKKSEGKSFFAVLKKSKKVEPASVEPDEKPVKPAKTKKPKADAKAPRFGGKTEKSLTLLTELENGRQLYWQLEADKLVQVKDAPTGPVYSFSKEDFRYRSEAPLSYKQANDLALQEVGESVQIVNRSKDLQAVYAARQERVLSAKNLLYPGQQALDRLLIERKKLGAALICGFLFKDAAEEGSVAILFHVNADGEASKPQISVNPDSMEFVITQFAVSRKLDKNNTEVVLFTNAEFLGAIAGAAAFPNEPVWRGVPVRTILAHTAVVSVVVALGFAGYAGFQFLQMQQLSKKQAQLTEAVDLSKKRIGNMLHNAVPSFAKAVSLDPEALTQRAQGLYLPDTRMTLVATPDKAEYIIAMPIARQETFNNQPSALDPITPEKQALLMGLKAPEGCNASSLYTSGNLNETQLKITCESDNSAFRGYRSE